MATSVTEVEKIKDPESSAPSIEMPNLLSPTEKYGQDHHGPSAVNRYMLFCTLIVGFGGLNWG